MTQMVYSTRSHQKIAHKSNCHVIRRIGKAYRRTIESPKEAFDAGFRRCKYCCPSIETLYARDRERIEALLSEEKLKLTIKNEQAEIQSGTSVWRIVWDYDTLRLRLFYKNTHNRPSDLGTQMPGYHLQTAARAQTVYGLLKFIGSHDAYRRRHPDENQNEGSFLPQKPVKQGQWEAAKAKKVNKNGRSYLVNVQIRSDPDLSPWLTGQRGDFVRSFGRSKKRNRKRKPAYDSDCA